MKAASNQPPKYETIEFERIFVQASQNYYPEFFQNAKISVEQVVGKLLVTLRHEIYGQHDYQEYKVYIAIPANWWEHLKQDHFPKWYINHFPIKTKPVGRVITFDHKKLFPESTIKAPSVMGPVVFHSSCSDPDVNKF